MERMHEIHQSRAEALVGKSLVLRLARIGKNIWRM